MALRGRSLSNFRETGFCSIRDVIYRKYPGPCNFEPRWSDAISIRTISTLSAAVKLNDASCIK